MYLNNVFKRKLDQYWQHQDIIYDFPAQIEGSKSYSSNVSRVDVGLKHVKVSVIFVKLTKKSLACAGVICTAVWLFIWLPYLLLL